MTNIRALCAAIILGLAAAAPSQAATAIYSLGTTSASFAAGPYGSVTVTEQNGSLVFSETLSAGYQFHQSNNNHDAFAFSLVNISDASVSNLTFSGSAGSTSSYTLDGTSSEAPFGNFDYAIVCPSCTGGYSDHPTSLTFTLSSASQSLTLNSLEASSGNSQVFFSSDLVSSNGTTGNVGGTFQSRTASAVPEPASWAMMLFGFAAIGYALRHRRAEAFSFT